MSGFPSNLKTTARVLDTHGAAACFMDADERIQGWNRTYEAFFPEHVGLVYQGQPYAENLRRYFEENVVGLAAEEIDEQVRSGLERHRGMRDALAFQRRDGRWLQSRVEWFTDGACLKTWVDITESQHRGLTAGGLSEALGAHDVAFAEFDAAGRFLVANRKMSDSHRYCARLFQSAATYDDHLRSHLSHLIAASDRERFVRLMERTAIVENLLAAPEVFMTRAGGWVRVEEHRSYRGGFYSLLIDVTEVRKLGSVNKALSVQTRDLRRLMEELAAARDTAIAERNRAEEANRAKTDFLARMSHELRTPLNAIIGFSDVMRSEMMGPIGTPAYIGYCDDINSAGRHLLSLINDVLDLSKVEAGRLQLCREAFDPAELAAECMGWVGALARERDITVSASISPVVTALFADRRAMAQIITNLLSNACKFTPRGGQVVLNFVRRNDGAAQIVVTDNGIGMDAADRRKAMELFGQADNLLTRSQTGTGLGLPLVKRLAELHGGQLRIKSEPGRGTTVTVTVPQPGSAADQPGGLRGRTGGRRGKRGSGACPPDSTVIQAHPPGQASPLAKRRIGLRVA